MKIYITFTSLIFIFWGLSCSSVNNKNESKPSFNPNPNGDSELTVLMRDMYIDAFEMKQQIEKGEKPKSFKVFEKIHTAKASEPGKVDSPNYTTFADSYLSVLESLKKASTSESPQLYTSLIQSCMNCHRSFCPGPMVRIKKLYLEKEKQEN